MADQNERLIIATVKAENGANIIYRFSNDPVVADEIPTESGAIQNLKQVAADIKAEGQAAVTAAVSEGIVDLSGSVASAGDSAARAELAADAAIATGKVYPDTAAGLAATTNTQYFSVPSADSNEYLILYQNVAGTAIEKKRYSSATVSGLTINAGKAFPLKSANRGGTTSLELVAASRAILDIKVIGAPAGKHARFAWYGNGTTAFGAADYGMIFELADTATYTSNGVAVRITERTTAWEEATIPGSTIVTRHYRATTIEGLQLSITYDKAVFAETLGSPVVLNGSTLPGYSWIIDPACYVATRVLNSLRANIGVNYPLASKSRAGAVSAEVDALKRGILQVRVTGVPEGKFVRIGYMANGTTAFPPNTPNYGWNIELADIATYNTTGASKILVNRIDPWEEVAGEGTLVTRYYHKTVEEGISVAVTYDTAVFGETNGTPLVLNDPAKAGYSWVIDPSCYIPVITPNATKEKGLLYSATADSIYVVWRFSDTMLRRTRIGRQGPNLLNDIREISEQAGTALTLDGTWTVLASQDITDWLGPYQVTAVSGGDGGGTVQSTGGNHAINNTTTPTAEQISRAVYVDGGLLVSGNGQAEEVMITWANRIMGHNTMSTARRYILREDYVMRIRPGSIEVVNEITALEDIVIGNYFGLQCYDPGHDQTLHFFNGQDGGRVTLTPTVAQYSGNPTTYPNVWGVTLRGANDRNMTLWMDRTYGIAAPGFLPTSGLSGMIFHQANTKKAYHQLIAPGKPLPLASGESAGWRGGYIFSTNLSAEADLAQRYYDGGKPSYLVAMTVAGSAKLTTSLVDANRKTTLDGAGMTVPGYVSPKGLSVKATGYSVAKVAIT